MPAEIAPLRKGDPLQLGVYRLVGLLGEGGQGTVYLGQTPSGQQVAIKTLHARLRDDAESRRRFLGEVAAARSVGTFGTAQVLEVDFYGEQPFIVSEYIRGESLQQLINREGPRDAGGLRRLMLATAAALQAIHQAGIVHRDFKPSNILLAADGPRVVDFGIARALEGTTMLSSAVVGTPPYMSPEQVSGAKVGPESDVFSWGVAMVFAATGQPAFGQDSIPAVFNRILTREPSLDGVPDDLRALLRSCLAKDPNDRPTASELLQRMLGHAPQSAPRSAGRATRPAPQPAGETVARTGGPFGLALAAQVIAALVTFILEEENGLLFGIGVIAWILGGGFAALALRNLAKRRRA
ncbi:serine/threonine-protein kinase [Rhizohabitans arisaemae]|uniref:serine/threonine-protein kinase n=1 Tax=Rhizohabitans arisaemae TaxID=2720610 RepID=UPI0024B06354|nr:serine/threonine-protein kinase [Rhizohabitans arisaemae]